MIRSRKTGKWRMSPYMRTCFKFSRIALDTTDTDDRVKLLMKALTKLSPHQREIIYLYYVNELGHNEIAGILGINYQSSKNLLSRTLRKLRRWFSLEL